MKIGDRIIHNKRIVVNTDREFLAIYKNHEIVVKFYRKIPYELPEWDIDVRSLSGGIAAATYCQRANIHDAIIFALDGALL